MACSRCGAGAAEYYDTAGNVVCRRCHYAQESALQDERAKEALIEEMPEQLREIGIGRRVDVVETYVRPGTMLKRGLLVMLCAGLGAGTWLWFFGLDRLAEILLAATGLGFAMSARGWQVRHYE